MFLVKLLVVAIVALFLPFVAPWYSPFIACFIIGIILSNKPGNNFLAGFLGVGLVWLGYTLWLDIRNQHYLSSRIAQLFSNSLQTDISYGLLILITFLLGALLGGLSTMAGAMLVDDGSRKRLRKAVKSGSYRLKLK
ncbi:MAG TPA: hypothetical protein PLA16_05850 [Chitinophagales bacterium]|jgi:hypothetical protein|nr:hypothetical protein [Chitinophagales bacterium]HPA35868.1 hypothetical protein [Chitinophagales bacterium]HQD11569.1 hypothetical protein [Chitinophagales bacterium]HQO30929.1 hypothetical protein [Chitinophagales bacterium]HQO88867.1 hypothetical protein [Chitinophagales bacterium]